MKYKNNLLFNRIFTQCVLSHSILKVFWIFISNKFDHNSIRLRLVLQHALVIVHELFTYHKVRLVHITHISVPDMQVGQVTRLKEINIQEFDQNVLMLLDRDGPSTLQLRWKHTRIVWRLQYASIADNLARATNWIGDKRQNIYIGEVKAKFEAAEGEHTVRFEHEYESGRGGDDLRVNMRSAVT